jgi:hypothetical protein
MIHKVFNVVAGGEVITRTGQNHRSNPEIPGGIVEVFSEVSIHIPSEGIHLLWTVEGDG